MNNYNFLKENLFEKTDLFDGFQYKDYIFDVKNFIITHKDNYNPSLYTNVSDKIKQYAFSIRDENLCAFNSLRILHLCPTWQCSRGCDYCYAEKMKKKKEELTVDVLDAKIKEIESKNNTSIEVYRFFGGEPIEAQNIKDIFIYLSHRPQTKNISVSTGCIDVQKLENVFSVLNNTQIKPRVSISLDLGMKYNARHLKYSSIGKLVSELLKLSKVLNLDMIFRCNITSEFEETVLKNNIQDIQTYIDGSVPILLGVIKKSNCNDLLLPSPKQLIDTLSIFYQYIKEDVFDYDVERYYKKMFYSDEDKCYILVPHLNKCGVGESVLGMDPLGRLSICHMGFIYDYAYYLQTNDLNINPKQIITHPYCTGCIFEHVCGNGCHFRNIELANYPNECVWHMFRQKMFFETNLNKLFLNNK